MKYILTLTIFLNAFSVFCQTNLSDWINYDYSYNDTTYRLNMDSSTTYWYVGAWKCNLKPIKSSVKKVVLYNKDSILIEHPLIDEKYKYWFFDSSIIFKYFHRIGNTYYQNDDSLSKKYIESGVFKNIFGRLINNGFCSIKFKNKNLKYCYIQWYKNPYHTSRVKLFVNKKLIFDIDGLSID